MAPQRRRKKFGIPLRNAHNILKALVTLAVQLFNSICYLRTPILFPLEIADLRIYARKRAISP